MQPLKISKPLSIRSQKPRHFLLGLVVLLVLCVLAWISTPFIIRANRGVISSELTRISSIEDNQQEPALKRLLAVTGHDQAVARSLAELYSRHNLHELAGKTYEQARGPLYLEASAEYSQALDYNSLSRVSQKSTRQRPTADSLAWQGIALFNQGSTDKGCEKARESLDKNQDSQLAQMVATACEYQRNNESDPWKLVSVQLNQIALDKLSNNQDSTSSAKLLQARLLLKNSSIEQLVTVLNQAFRQTPFDREVLEAIKHTCSQVEVTCGDLTQQAQSQLDLLPTQ